MGISSKLCSGGGEGMLHSRVLASQGSRPAILPFRLESTQLKMNRSIDAAMRNDPIVSVRLYEPHPMLAG